MSKKKETDAQLDFEGQRPGEEVLFVFHKHPIVMRKGLVFGLLGPPSTCCGNIL